MKTVDELYAALLQRFADRAGFTPTDDCELAVRLYAAAAELQALEIQAGWVLDQSFPQTAQGTYLDAHAQLRGLSRTAAVRAAGVLRFAAAAPPAADLHIEAGCVCLSAAGTRFETAEDAVLAAGSLWTEVPARAVEAGADGNAVAGTVTTLTACPAGITAVTNPAAFAGGADAEADESLRARVLDSYHRLPNGANAAFYEETAVACAGVTAARAVGRARGIGTVDVYISASAGLPDSALLAAVQSELALRREIAVDVAVKAPNVHTVDVTAQIAAADGYDFAAVKTAAEAAVGALFTGKLLGRPVRTAALVSRLCAIPGVENCHLLAPAADVAADDTVLPVLGALQITAMEEG